MSSERKNGEKRPAPGKPAPKKGARGGDSRSAAEHVNNAEYREANECRRKVAYKDKDTAVRIAVKMKERTGFEYVVYECQFCHTPQGKRGWHIGRERT